MSGALPTVTFTTRTPWDQGFGVVALEHFETCCDAVVARHMPGYLRQKGSV